MKKNLFFLMLLLVLDSAIVRAQECMGVVLKEGSGYEMTSLNAKGKKTGRTVYNVKKVSKVGANVVIDLSFVSYDAKDKEIMTNAMKMSCNGNELMVDASMMMGQDQSKQFEAFDMKFTSKDLVYPAKLTVGQSLPDASLHGEGTSGPLTMTNDLTITNRKVEGKQSVTVPAGTFETYKVRSDMNVTAKTVIKMSLDFQTVSYRSNKILWDVKSESYRKGKLVGTTELSKIF